MDEKENVDNNTTATLQLIATHVLNLEKNTSLNQNMNRKCEILRILKEKCCDNEIVVSTTAFHGIIKLVQKKILSKSHALSIFISLLPTVIHYESLIYAIGEIILLEVQNKIMESNDSCNIKYGKKGLKHHPFIIVLKQNKEKSWFQVYLFILKVIDEKYNKVNLICKIKLIRPILQYIFWSPAWKGSQFQLKLFQTLIMNIHRSEILNVTLETLLYQPLDIYYCLYLRDFFEELFRLSTAEKDIIISGTCPLLAVAIKWLIIEGHDPSLWINLLSLCLTFNDAASSVILYLLSDVLLKTPSIHVNSLIDLCKSIIFNFSLNKYVCYKFLSVVLNYIITTSVLIHPLQLSVNEILEFLRKKSMSEKDGTTRLVENKYFKIISASDQYIKFAANLIIVSNSWCLKPLLLIKWLENLEESKQNEILLNLHYFLCGIILKEKERIFINPCLNLLYLLIKSQKDLSTSLLCILFFKLTKETDPFMQKTYLSALPNLANMKENVPLIMGIIESLKKGNLKITKTLVIQLYVLLWKIDNRTYSYLHKMLHEANPEGYSWELNISKSVAVREISRLAPHSHAKDLVGILSKILNECASHESGLASAIAIQAITYLCKSFVVDVAGAWNAIQPKLSFDKRPQVVMSLCRFFEEIPNIKSSNENYDKLVDSIVPMLWNYSFSNDDQITKCSLRALSKFEIENLQVKLLPDIYRKDIKVSKELEKDFKVSDDFLSLPYVPGECWVQFLQKIDDKVLRAGADLLMVLIERELKSLPRPIFFLPPEKPEPLSYSYLPQKCICRALVENLLKNTTNSSNPPAYLKEIIHILSHKYSKILPPLNWGFMKSYFSLDSDFQFFTISLMAKQGMVSKSANMILQNFFETIQWNIRELEETSMFYEVLPLLCQTLSYNNLQKFLEGTMEQGKNDALKKNSRHFKKMLWHLGWTLKNSSVSPGLKAIITSNLEKILVEIPPDHEIMKSFAKCITEFPVHAIKNIISVKASKETNRYALRRAILIRQAIALREDIKTPLSWLSEAIEIAAELPSEQNFILNIICFIIRRRRDCNHFVWIKELSWKIQESIRNLESIESHNAAMFFVDVFINGIFVLSGYDCLFNEKTEFTVKNPKILEKFPQSLSLLLSQSSEWLEHKPKLGKWLQNLLKWKELPIDYGKVIAESLLFFKEIELALEEDTIFNFADFFF